MSTPAHLQEGTAAPSLPSPHFLRPTRAPLRLVAQPSSAPSRITREEGLRASERESEGGSAQDRRVVHSALGYTAGLQSTANATARPLREAQPHAGKWSDDIVLAGHAYQAQVATGGDQGGADGERKETPGGGVAAPSSQGDVALSTGKADLSRMTSTRRYMAQLDEDDDPVGREGDRATWYSSAWESEARDSVASFEPLQLSGSSNGTAGRTRPEPPGDSTLTTRSVDADPFSYSAYAALPSPHDAAFPPALAQSDILPLQRPSQPSSTTQTPPACPTDDELLGRPALSQSTSRVRSQILASSKNFSRPFVPQGIPPPASPPSCDIASSAPPARRPSTTRAGIVNASPLDRSSSLGHASLLDRSSSTGHSSQTSHSTHVLAWDDGRRGYTQEDAKRAIALARSQCPRALEEEDEERETRFEELRQTQEPLGESDDVLDAYGGEEEPPTSTRIAQFAPPPSVSAYTASEYDDTTVQYMRYAPERLRAVQFHDAPSSLAPSPHSFSPSTPAHLAFSSQPPSPPPQHSPLPQHSPPPQHSPVQQRNVLRKARPAAPSNKAASHPMGRSLSASSTPSSEPATKQGVWTRFRARARSRGASERLDPGLWAQERPAVPLPHHANSSVLLVSDLSASLPPLPRRYPASPTPHSDPASPAFAPGSHLPISAPLSAPLSQAEFARLATRPTFPHRGASARSAVEGEWVLKSVQGARTVRAETATVGGGARAVVHSGTSEVGQHEDDEVERLGGVFERPEPSAVVLDHHRPPSGAPSHYSGYSLYSLPPSASPTSPAPPASPAPSAPAPSQGHVVGKPLSMSTLQKLEFAIGSSECAGPPSVVRPTASVKQIKRDPVTPDDYLQLGINLHEGGELERAAWCFEQSARKDGGCGAGMLMYGLTLRHGWGCQVNAPLGFRFLQMAAETVVADLDRVVFGGRSLSEAEANTRAAKSELVLALHEIGASYRFGWGVEKSKKLAVAYFKLAADLGDVDAQQDLAFSYANGKGCKKDLKAAARYYRLAIAQGASDFGLSWVYKDKYLDA
ncbi:hypothetical protein JCM3770_006862 [Rhodotorula araucariae]